ncbi:MAG TPA: hypothetical protein VFX05_14360 [Casimicrobiaceae bacterium]|nr:hypothetical protein [Casimicrobiaceae bacterium]
MHLALLVPGLLDIDAVALASCAPLARVAALADARPVDDAEAELLRVLDVHGATAPLAALGAGIDVGGDWIARADPVTTSVSHEDVRIVGRVDDLDAAEAAMLVALLGDHFREDALGFAAPRSDAVFVRSARPHDIATVPLLAAIDRPLRDKLPSGADARRWRRWFTEVQMLLHEHALAARATRPVNAVWFASGGTLAPAPARRVATFAGPGRAGDVVRGLARVQGDPTATLDAIDAISRHAPGDVAVVADPVHDAAGVAAVADAILAPLLAALDAGAAQRLVLIAEGRAGAARWDVARPGLFDRLFPRKGRFAPPARDDQP